MVFALSLILLQTSASAQGQFNLLLQGNTTITQGSYYSIPVAATNLSFVVYAAVSDTPIYTMIMNSSQYSDFQNTLDINDSIVVNYTNFTIELMLQNKTRYMVLYSPNSEANVSYYVNATSNFSHANSTTFAGAFFELPPYSSKGFRIHSESEGSPFNMTLYGISDEPVLYSVYDTSTGKVVFNTTTPQTVTNLNASAANDTSGYNLRLQPGNYTLNITNPSARNAIVYYAYGMFPDYIDPFLENSRQLSQGLAPTGIASFGLTYRNGKPVPYHIATEQVIGYANITSMEVNNPTNATTANETGFSNGLSAQLNEILVVVDKNGQKFVYWPQDVAYMTTNTSTSGIIQMEDNILNMSGDCSVLSNKSVYAPSGGYVSPLSIPNHCSQYYYGIYNRSTTAFDYTLPLNLYLIMNVSAIPNTGTLVSMGVRINDTGTIWFDNVTLLDPNVSGAYLYVSGNEYTPSGAANLNSAYYDSEFIFGGPGNGTSANFTNASAQLQMYYYDNTTDTLETFPSTYTFGADTAEASYNLHVSYKDGYAVLSHGNATFNNLYQSPPESFFVKHNETTPTAQVRQISSTPQYNMGFIDTAFGIMFLLVLLVWRHIRRIHARKHGLVRSPASKRK